MSHQNLEHDRVQVQVQVAVDVIERKARGVEFFKLRANLRLQLRPQTSSREIAKAHRDRAIAEAPLRIDQAGNLFRRKRGMAAQQC